MAYVAQNLTDEELKKQQQDQEQGAPLTTGASDLLGSGGVASPAAKPNQPSSSGSWTNLKSYLNANQDQAQTLADQVSSNLNNQGSGAKSAIDTAVGDYNTALNKNSPNPTDLIGRANANPVDFTKNQNDVESFKNLKSGIFTGPDIFENQPNYTDLASKTQNAQDLASGIQTTGGQKNLVKSLNPNMTSGQADLNQLILFGNEQAKKKVSDASQPFQNIKQYLNDQASTADKNRTNALNNWTKGAQDLQTQFVQPQTQNLVDMQNAINSRVQADSIKKSNAENAKNQLTKSVADKSNYISSDFLPQIFPNGLNQRDNSYFDEGSAQNYIDSIGSSYNPVNGKIHPLGNKYVTSNELNDYKNKVNSGYFNRGYSENVYSDISGKNDPNWFQNYFEGFNIPETDPNFANESTPEEAAKILALQQLLDNGMALLTPDQLSQAGTYKNATIGRFKGF